MRISKKSSTFAPKFRNNMKQLLRTAFLALICISYSLPVFSWGQEGHRIISKIAYDNLTAKARKQVDKISGRQGMIYWANWPDEIKSDTIYAESIRDGWHYQDFPAGMSDSAVVATLTDYPKEGGNLFRALDSLVNVLTSSRRSPDPKCEHTLRFVVHLTADRYCPMHMAHLDDRGGNAVKMAWFSKQNNTNLHTVWDTKLIDSQGYSYTEYAEKLEIEYAYLKKTILSATEADMLLDSYHLTEQIYAYQRTWDGNTYHYIYRWHIPMERQLYVAGIRLANLLNEIYK